MSDIADFAKYRQAQEVKKAKAIKARLDNHPDEDILMEVCEGVDMVICPECEGAMIAVVYQDQYDMLCVACAFSESHDPGFPDPNFPSAS